MPNTLSIGVAYSDQAIVGGSIDSTPIGAGGQSTISGTTIFASNQIGYTAGAQTAVTQSTSKSTGVTANSSCGRITMNNASLAAQTNVSFTLTNSLIALTDHLILTISAGGTAEAYNCWVSNLASGSAVITLRNITAATALSEAVVINFCIIHGQ